MSDLTCMILTVIGDDRPGLVGELAATISGHRGNWLESSMAHLSGKFAGIVKLELPALQVAPLRDSLNRLSGLQVMAAVASLPGAAMLRQHFKLSLVGHDRIGIVREVSQALAHHTLNVEQLSTYTSSAPMSAETLFHVEAELSAGADFTAQALIHDLEKISNDLMVDIVVDPVH